MSAPLHVVFGAGQVGAGLAARLRDRGLRVRVVRRTAGPVGAGLEVVAADATDPDAAAVAARGAAVIYHCMNPSAYTGAAWEAEFPRQGEALIAAAVANGARLVCLDNLYAYGPTTGPRREDHALLADGVKGRVRVAWDRALRDAAATRGLRFTVGRAGDFFGPGAADHSLLGASAVAGLRDGRRVPLVGDTTAPHAFSYVPDVVAGLAALGTAEADVEGRVFHLPVITVAPAALVAALAAALGVPSRTLTLPAWAVRALGPVVPMLRELGETLYQWDRPFLVDDGAFRSRFPGLATPLDRAAEEVAASVATRRAA